eukprot:11473784-Alexandrium_andersonii.AAC.1
MDLSMVKLIAETGFAVDHVVDASEKHAVAVGAKVALVFPELEGGKDGGVTLEAASQVVKMSESDALFQQWTLMK